MIETLEPVQCSGHSRIKKFYTLILLLSELEGPNNTPKSLFTYISYIMPHTVYHTRIILDFSNENKIINSNDWNR